MKVEVSIDELHCRLGHISHERAQMLVLKELIEGVDLDMMSKPSVYESCEWAKVRGRQLHEPMRDSMLQKLVVRSIQIYGDLHLSKRSIRNYITSVSPMILASLLSSHQG